MADSTYQVFKSLKWEMSQKDLILEMKDKEIILQSEKVESLSLKDFHLSQELAMSDHTTLELQKKTIGNQKTKLQQQEIQILVLQNEIDTLNKRFKGAQENTQLEYCNKSDLNQKTFAKIETQENPISESKSKTHNLNKELKCPESNLIEDPLQQKYIKKDYSSSKAIKTSNFSHRSKH